jgi:ectoine hydroxylase-related dioxygenase (phytanoyl-CoA dioxygenase family)
MTLKETTMLDLKSKVGQVSEQGYCVIESVYDEQECAQMRTIFKGLCHKKVGFSVEQSTIGFHPLLEWGPEMAPFYAKPVLVDLMAEVFDDDVRLAHSGAAVFNNALVSPVLTGWHNHYSWQIPEIGLQRRNAERVLCNVYVDGTMPEVGPLIVLPRSLNALTDSGGEAKAEWEGQGTVSIPSGSAVIFDTAVWHCSRRGSSDGLRHLWGGHYQGWNNPTPHPEDNTADNSTVTAYKNQLPLLKKLLEDPVN